MIEIDSVDSFQKEIKDSKGLSLVDFWAPWCGPCRMFSKTYERLSLTNTGAKFTKVNIDDVMEIAKECNISAIPTIVVFKDGQEIHRWTGIVSENEVQERINSAKEEES